MFISFEISKQLKDLGFNKSCLGSYDFKGVFKSPVSYLRNSDYTDNNLFYIAAPLYKQAEDFFREERNIHIEIYCNHSGWGYILTKTNGTTIKEITDSIFFDTHLESVVKAIEEAIKLCQK
jgi:hypothetical protein